MAVSPHAHKYAVEMRFDVAEVRRGGEARGMSQRELGRAIGVNSTTICRLERSNPSPLAVPCALIARELGVAIETIQHD